MNPIKGDILRGHLEPLILSQLDRGGGHGFEILRRLEQAGEGSLQLKEGTIYPAIYRLEQSGLVRGEWEENSGRRGPRRRIYHLTPKGRRQLAVGRADWRRFVTVIGGILEAET